MHILLTVLSVIGKILLAVLILLAVTSLLLLFAPVRYQAGAVHETGTPLSKLEIPFGIRYLAGIIRVDGRWKGGSWGAVLLLFGRKLKVIGDDMDPVPESVSPEAEKEKVPEPEDACEKTPETGNGQMRTPGEKEGGTKAPEKTSPEKPSAEKTSPPKKNGERKAGKTKEEKAKAGKKASRFSVMTGRAAQAVSAIWLRLIDLVTSIPDLLWKLPDSADAISDKADALAKEIRPWTRHCSKEAYRAIWRQVMILLSHYRPRRVKGHLSFGTGDPAMTGAAGGVIRRVLPAGCSRFELQPVFYDRMLDTDMILEGHVRLCHLVRAVVVLLLNKNIRKLIRRLRRRHGGK